ALLIPPLALGLAAIEALPILAYLGETWRGVHGFSPGAAMHLSATPAQLARILWQPGSAAHTSESFLASAYVGPIVGLLALIGLVSAPPRLRAGVAILGLLLTLLALGPSTPLLPELLDRVPLANLLRYPGKLLVALQGLIALGAAFGAARVVAAPLGRFGGRA